jgi:hypothetical protein
MYIRKFFGLCVHDWTVITKEIGESVIEHLKKTGYKKQHFTSGDNHKRLFIVLSCKKCGKLKQYTEVI